MELIDHVEKRIAQRGRGRGMGFIPPQHPCVVSLLLKTPLESDNLQSLRDRLASYWSGDIAKKVPIRFFTSMQDFSQESLKADINEVLRADGNHRGHNRFSNPTQIYFFDIIDCGAVESDEVFQSHCEMVKAFRYDDKHTINKILVLLHDRDTEIPDSVSQYIQNQDRTFEKETVYNAVFVLTDQLNDATILSDANKIKRLKDFMTVMAFTANIGDAEYGSMNFHDQFKGHGDYSNKIMTISVRNLKKDNFKIASAFLNGILESLVAESCLGAYVPVDERILKDLFYDNQGQLKIANNHFPSADLPKSDIFDNLPYSDNSLSSKHNEQSSVIQLMMERSFYQKVDSWIGRNQGDIKESFVESIFKAFSFTDIASNRTTIKEFLTRKTFRNEVVSDFRSAEWQTKCYFSDCILSCWAAYFDEVCEKITDIQDKLQQIKNDVLTACGGENALQEGYAIRYGAIAKDFLQKNGYALRKEIFNKFETEGIEGVIQSFSPLDDYIRDKDAFGESYMTELRARQCVDGAAININEEVARELIQKEGQVVYYPLMHGVALGGNPYDKALCTVPQNGGDELLRNVKSILGNTAQVAPIPNNNYSSMVTVYVVH